MELRYIWEFVTLEQIRNFTAAADTLYTTEATLSRHIKALEKELGQPLFQRTTRRIELTDFGQRFLVYAKKFVKLEVDLETDLLRRRPRESDRIIIGVFGPITSYAVIQKALYDFSARNEACTIGTVRADMPQLKENLKKKDYELAIVREDSAEQDDEFGRIPLLQERLCLVLPKDDPLAQSEQVDVAQLKGRSITIPSEYMLSHRLFLKRCHRVGFEPEIKSLLRGRGFGAGIVSLGGGVTVLIETMAVQTFNPDTQLIRPLSPPIYEYVNLLFLKSESQTSMVQSAIKCFEAARQQAEQAEK